MLNIPKIIGHRGVKDIAPENTILSINKAIEHNLRWIEIDVKTSKDNIPFLLHDDLLDRTTSGKGYPHEYNYREIELLDAGSWFDKKFSNAYPPRLEEVLYICSKNNIGLNIELKPNLGKEKKNVEAISSLIKNNIFNCQYFFSSFNYYSLELIREKIPNAHVSYLVNSIKKKINLSLILNDCLNLKCFSIGFSLNLIDQELVKICKENKFMVTVYSNKNISFTEALFLWDLGVDSIFIDNSTPYKKILNN